jgi:hypothetical protein
LPTIGGLNASQHTAHHDIKARRRPGARPLGISYAIMQPDWLNNAHLDESVIDAG